jgi:hypothetical protein
MQQRSSVEDSVGCGIQLTQEDRMATFTGIAPRLTSVVAHPGTAAGNHYRSGREHAVRAGAFPARPGLNMHFFGGKTIEHLTFTHIYLGGKAAWNTDDIHKIDAALPAAMEDVNLNNVIAQYFADEKSSTTFKPSRILEGPLPARVYRDTIESIVATLDKSNGLSGFDLTASVFCLLLPADIVLVDGNRGAHQERHDDGDDDDSNANVALRERDEAVDSKHGLGGYHGSIHPKHGTKTDTVYYSVGVYSDGANGIPSFDKPWKNICATFYHELCEARTDPDVEDAIRAGNDPSANDFIGWYSPKGGEIGDLPMEEAGADLGSVMKEVPLANGGGKVPIQLMWSNAVGGPEGPIAHKHPPASRT